MSGFRTVGTALCVGAATVSGVLAGTAEPASAEFVTRCVGQGGQVTVPGDLVVPRDKSCDLHGTTVTGDVRVAPSANLTGTGTEFEGSVRIAANGYLATEDARIAGSVVSTGGFGAFLVDTQIGGNAAQRSGDSAGGTHFLYLRGSIAGGDLGAETGEVIVEDSTIGGNVRADAGRYLDIYNSVVSGTLSVTGARSGTVVCDSEVYGDAELTGNSQLVQLGAHRPAGDCTGATYWGGNVTVADNSANVVVSNNIISGNLAGMGNQPVPAGEHNRVRGERSGQFTELAAPKSTKDAARAMAAPARPLPGSAADRRDSAERAAATAGKADL